jgi:hypothetical protein
MQEIWKDIAGYEGLYQVSNLGNVRNVNWRGSGVARSLRPKLTRDGYRVVRLCMSGKRKECFVHRLVAGAFLPNPGDLPIVNHKDENRENNAASNLEWCDHSYNMRYSMNLHPERQELQKRVRDKTFDDCDTRKGPYKRKTPVIQRSIETGEIVAVWSSLYEAAIKNKWHGSLIKRCCEGEHKTAYGYIWRYAS